MHQDQFYEDIVRQGYDYGPFFRLLTDITYNKAGNASCSLPLRAWEEQVLYPELDLCVIYPTTLDALIHMTMVGVSVGGGRAIPTMAFTHLGNIWVFHDLFKAPVNQWFRASAHKTMRGFCDAEYTVRAFAVDSGRPAVVAEGARGTAITSHTMRTH